jgi:hypothetical protein
MNLAAILGIYLLSLGCMSPGWLSPGRLPAVSGFAPQSTGQPPAVTSPDSPAPQSQNSVPASQPQTPAPPSQSSEPTQPPPSPTGPTPNSPGQAKPAPKRHRHHRKTTPSTCSASPAPLNPAVGNPADATKSAGAGSSNAGSANGATKGKSSALPPCPPPKKVVRNGGSNEPTVRLTGGTTAEQAVHQSSTGQLTAATEENLKKIAGLQLNPSQQEMVSQIMQFM